MISGEVAQQGRGGSRPNIAKLPLIAEAEQIIAASPYFERWRLPPGHEVFEHSPEANCAITGEIAKG